MKKWILISVLVTSHLSFLASYGQEPTVRSRSYLEQKFKTGSKPTQQDFWDWLASFVHKTEDGAGDPTFNGNRTITTPGFPQFNPGGTTVAEFLNNTFFQPANPIATISATTSVYERMAAGADIVATLNYTITRPVGCPAITSIFIDGQSITPPVINEGGTYSSSLSRPLPRNTNRAYTINLTAGTQQAINSTTVTWSYARYWGVLDKNTGITDADILSLTGAGVGTGKELNETRQKTYNGIDGAGKYLLFVFQSSAGDPVFFINGLNSTAFTRVRDGAFTNAPGATYNVQVWVSNTRYNSPVAQFEIR